MNYRGLFVYIGSGSVSGIFPDPVSDPGDLKKSGSATLMNTSKIHVFVNVSIQMYCDYLISHLTISVSIDKTIYLSIYLFIYR